MEKFIGVAIQAKEQSMMMGVWCLLSGLPHSFDVRIKILCPVKNLWSITFNRSQRGVCVDDRGIMAFWIRPGFGA
jgi:hypothetical protein